MFTRSPGTRLPLVLLATAALVLTLGPGVGRAVESAASLEDARREFAAGRAWHAAEILESLDPGELGREGELLLARARTAFNDWAGVLEIAEQAWVDSVAPVEGPWLRGRALEADGRFDDAARAFELALERAGRAGEAATSPDGAVPHPWVMAARFARAAARSGVAPDGLLEAGEARARVRRALDAASSASERPLLRSALLWEVARSASAGGDTALVRLAGVGTPGHGFGDDVPALRAEAALAAGDSALAERSFLALAGDEPLTSRRAGHLARAAELALARGDTAVASERFLVILESDAGGAGAVAAAAAGIDLGLLRPDRALAAARTLDRSGDGRRALAAYDLHVSSAAARGDEPSASARVARARLASTVPSRVEEAVEEFRALDEHPDPAIGARVLDIWAGLRRRQGQTENYRTLRRWLVERYPDTDQAAEIVFLRGDAAQDRQDWAGAIRHFSEVAEMAPTRALAGRARMRIGQIQAQQGQMSEAVETFRAYLERFPRGRRWTEASFWAGRILIEEGDTAGARPFLEPILEHDPWSYYAPEAANLMGRPYGADPAELVGVASAPWVEQALVELDFLEAAGLADAANRVTSRWIDRADRQGRSAQYALAEGLIARGRTIEGINLGWALVRAEEPWNRRLLTILYPFPQREMVELEARESGLDPILVAALIRQESAWDRDIVSHAGAVGLMQVMPATGRQLARAIGPSRFTPESLESAEVNLHLGSRFLRDMLDRFGPDLPLVLSAYNAGPTRARRWQQFPEAGDRLSFTERIPFSETRGYVKNVTRNVAVYRALYGTALADTD